MVEVAQASLTIKGGPDSGKTVPLSQRPLALGRRADNDVVIDEATVSRRHALILGSPDGFVLRDLNTTNVTFVNQRKVDRQETTLQNGDTIRLAGSEVTLIFHQDLPATATMDREPAATGAVVLEPFRPQPPPGAAEPTPQTDEKGASLLTMLESRRRTVVSRPEIVRQVWPELSGSSQADFMIDQSIERLRARTEYDPLKPVRLLTVGDLGFLLL